MHYLVTNTNFDIDQSFRTQCKQLDCCVMFIKFASPPPDLPSPYPFPPLPLPPLPSGAGTIFQQGGQAWCVTQPFPAGGSGRCESLSGTRGRAPEANAFWQQYLLKINIKSGLWVAVYTPNSYPISDVHWLVRR